MKIGVFDFEATDKDTNTARITQGAISIYENGREVYHYSALVFDENYEDIHPAAQAITGITRAQLEEHADSPNSFFSSFVGAVIRCDYICGHNIRAFDLPLLSLELKRLGDCKINSSFFETVFKKPTIDTRLDLPYPDHIDTRKLLYLAAEYGYANPMAHSARHDVDATAYLLFKFDLDTVLARAASKDLLVRADVSFDTKELAKERKYQWNAEKKIWTKTIKECDLDKEQIMSKFNIIRLG